ncbi:hypothetical protein GLOIN_2v1489650, partial [Rhizophagus irregularis DAOM 181602=DAOM 197198]
SCINYSNEKEFFFFYARFFLAYTVLGFSSALCINSFPEKIFNYNKTVLIEGDILYELAPIKSVFFILIFFFLKLK